VGWLKGRLQCSKFVLILILFSELKSLRWFEVRISGISFPIFHFIDIE
jgi:hypothetical protein